MTKEAKVTPLNALVSLTMVGLMGWGIISCTSAVNSSMTPEKIAQMERENMDAGSVGREPWGGGCVDLDTVKSRIKEIDWSQVRGSASKSKFVKDGAGTLYVFNEMHRLGTEPCPDIQPSYESFIGKNVKRKS